ncbi:MAG: hypothetical protein HXY43_18755 [Fischerella sp.]|uniref:hypothetical protein n=1 Tax=Fischerella sp. TaxID=1191 RepID=UPI00182F70D9|nr:hypothetical protein [Fischerella sp.]NWF61234.1 hypothetical protein [Fischerella sp.]
MDTKTYLPGLKTALEFPLVEALFGRRARRFSLGAAIPDGPLAFTSRHQPLPLSELEQMMVLTAAAGNTGWHYMITRHARYAPHLSNYSAAAGGRTFPSAAGFHTSEIFFTNDDGVYFFETRDAHALVERQADEDINLDALLAAHRQRIRKLTEGRLHIPPAEPYMEGHNTWCVNRPGSLLIIPVGDIAQHMIANLCFLVQNGYCIYDDVNREQIPGLEKFKHLVNLDEPFPMTFIDQYSLTECTAELSTCCYAGMLMLQAMGLGGWMFDGMDRHVVLGASGDPDVPGLGFRYDTDERWALPNPTGLPGVFEAFCPPHYPDMRAAVEAFAKRKFGSGGPFHPDTPGPWKETAKVRTSAEVHSEEFKECVALMAQYIYDRFGKFPGTVPSVFILTYLQAHHLDLEFYDHHFQPGAYLKTHAQHMTNWHSTNEM